MSKEEFEFDLITRRFLINRWETETGKRVKSEIIEVINLGGDPRSVLDSYVLGDDPNNSDPYGHPYYPPDRMLRDEFWVLTDDDLRGIKFHNEKFNNNSNWSRKNLCYAYFYNCELREAYLDGVSLTHTTFNKCNLEGACLSSSGGYCVRIIDSNIQNTDLCNGFFIESDVSGSNFSNSYLESVKLIDIKVSYLTVFDSTLKKSIKGRELQNEQLPEILKYIRLSYEKAEIWPLADKYLFLERQQNRKELLWRKMLKSKSIETTKEWFYDFIWGVTTGYGVKPLRLLLIALTVPVIFSILFYLVGNPKEQEGLFTSLYYSFTTFATLGYGDLYYSEARWIMRIISTIEAMAGAVLIATFVAVMSRKVLRH